MKPFKHFLNSVSCLILSLVLLLCVGCKKSDPADSDAVSNDVFEPVLRFVVTSDLHIRNADENYQSYERLEQLYTTAYAYADAQTNYNKLDGIFFTGDNTNSGTKEQQTYFFNYLADHTREGTVTRAVMGNHEYISTGNFKGDSPTLALQDFLSCSGYEAADAHLVIGGYHFIFLSTDRYSKNNNMYFSPSKLSWLRQELDIAKTDTPNKPIFVFQHEPPSYTMEGSANTAGDMSLNKLFSEYPQVIDFSGHTHIPLTLPQSVWQGKYTALTCGSLAYLSIPAYDASGNILRCKQTNETGGYKTGDHEEGTRTGGMYYIVEVDASHRVRVLTYNIFTQSIWGEPIMIDSLDPAEFQYTVARKDQAVQPTFDASATISVLSTDAANSQISFPQASCKDNVANYRIEIYQGENLLRSLYRLSENYFGDAAPTVLPTDLWDLSPDTYTLKIFAISSYGLQSEPLTGTLTIP